MAEILDDTPPAAALLDYWREMLAKDRPVSFGPDRAAAILAYIAELEALVDQLRGTIQFNRERTREQLAEKNERIQQLRNAALGR